MNNADFAAAAAPWFDVLHPMNQLVRGKPTVEELERLLMREEDCPITILPNGEIRALDPGERAALPKLVTMRENLGGEYAAASS